MNTLFKTIINKLDFLIFRAAAKIINILFRHLLQGFKIFEAGSAIPLRLFQTFFSSFSLSSGSAINVLNVLHYSISLGSPGDY